jgi:hypothetical protein
MFAEPSDDISLSWFESEESEVSGIAHNQAAIFARVSDDNSSSSLFSGFLLIPNITLHHPYYFLFAFFKRKLTRNKRLFPLSFRLKFVKVLVNNSSFIESDLVADYNIYIL